jgi:hypothetical protein
MVSKVIIYYENIRCPYESKLALPSFRLVCFSSKVHSLRSHHLDELLLGLAREPDMPSDFGGTFAAKSFYFATCTFAKI